MATSGTATFNPKILEMFEEAYERCGLEMKTGWDVTTARRSFNLLMGELANRGLNAWTFDQETLALTSPTSSYVLPLDTVDVLEGTIRTNNGNATTQSDLVISRVSLSDYMSLPNKLTLGRPYQYTIMRETAGPVIYFYQAPDAFQTYTFFYWRLRRIQDAGTTPSNTADVPFRFVDAVISGLAYRLASKRKEAFAMVPQLKAVYEEALALAQDEDRDRSSTIIIPFVARIY